MSSLLLEDNIMRLYGSDGTQKFYGKALISLSTHQKRTRNVPSRYSFLQFVLVTHFLDLYI